MGDLWLDLKYGARMLRKRPGFTAVALLTLALGIGANSAIFSAVNAILMSSLPLNDADRLVLFSDAPSEGTSDGSPFDEVWHRYSFASYRHFAENVAAFESLAAFRSGEGRLSVLDTGRGETEAQLASGHLVTGNFFEVLQAPALLGRTLTAEDDVESAPPVAVLSYSQWQKTWGGAENVLGRSVTVNGTPLTIVGVMPKSFFGLRVRQSADYWIPLHLQPKIEQRDSYLPERDVYWLNLVGRLKPGASLGDAQAQVDVALKQLLRSQAGDKPDDDWQAAIDRGSIRLAPGAAGISGLRSYFGQPLRLLMVVAGFVLLIACANLTNLLLSRATERRPEIAMRLAMGAGRGRLIRQLLTESVLLAGLGGALGLLLALWGVDALKVLVSKTAPIDVGLNLPVLAFTAAVSIVAGLLVGLAPALKAGRGDLAAALKTRGEGGGAAHLRKGLAPALVVAQVALSLVLLVGSGLLVRSLVNLSRAEVGFARDGVVLVDIDPRIAGLTPAETGPYYQRLLERLRAVPGVRAATLETYSPMSGSSSSSSIVVEGVTPPPGEDMVTWVNRVAPQFVETLGLPLVKGRQFDERDGPTAPRVAFVNEAFVRAFYPDRDPIGMHVGFGSEPKDATITIVGVVGDARYDNPREAPPRMLFLPLLQESGQMAFATDLGIRTSVDPDSVVPAVRRAIAEVDARVPIAAVTTLARQVADSVRADLLLAQLVGGFSLLALLLACVGLYGVVSQSVARRTNEVGIRMALGAGRGDILAMLMREAGVLILAGLAIGIPGALVASRLLMSQLFGITPADPLTLVGSAGVLLAVAVLAGFIPARRASRVEPLVSLRTE